MGTDINIKKRIAVQEESVTITPDVNSINFIGAGVTAFTVGDDVTVNIPGSIGATVYYLNETITQAPYKEFSSIPTVAVEQTIATVVGVGSTVTIQSFQTPSGVPNTTNIPAGLWQFYLHFSGTFGDSWDVYAEVYKRDLGGIETLLLTTDVIPTTALSAIPTMILTDSVFPASTVLTTDRIVVKVKATNTGVAGQTITFHTEGTTNYSVGTTTLNQIVPTGAVTNVTGTAPVVSSGGTTPAISMAQADSVTDGYLSSTDWNTFNNKQDLVSLTTVGTTGLSSFLANVLNIPQYQGQLTLTTTGTSGPATLVGDTLNIPSYSFTDTNIYNTDGTLTGNRIVTMNANTLLFDGTNSDIRYTPNSVGGYLQLEGKASGVPRFGISVPAFGLNPAAGFQLGMRAWDDATFAGYGQVGDAFFYAGNATYGLNFLNPPGVGTADYIRFYAGIDATGTSHIHIQGTGATKGYVGLGTETPTEKLDVAGKTRTTTFQMTTAPTAGYVLTSDASGNGTWTAPTSSSGRFGIADSAGAYTYYTTLSAAITAAVSGQTVEFFTDYTETGNVPINLKDGVNINGNGHTYTCTYSAGSISIFVNATGTQTVSNLTIIGIGMNASSSGFYISFTAQRTYFSGVVIRMDNGYGSSTFGGGIVDGLIVSVTGTARGLGVNGGKYVNCQAFSTNGEAIYCPLANGTVDNCRGESTGNVGIYGGGIYNCYAIGSNAGIWLQGGGGAYNCTGISSAGIGIYITGGSAVHHNLTGISTASIGIRVFAPSIKINGFMAYSTASNAYIGFTDTYAVNGYAESTAAASGYGGGQNMNTYFLSSWNNASGHAFTITDACQFAECVMETTSTSANAIYCASPVSIKYTGCKFKTSTTPVNANVTQGMVNTEDAYGNVKM